MKMNLSTLVVAVGLAALAGQAQAAIQTASAPGSNGELFLNVFDPVAQVSYTRDLGVHLNDFLANATAIDGKTGKLLAPTNGSTWAVGSTPTIGAGSVVAPGYTVKFATDPLFTQTFGGSFGAGSYWNILTGEKAGVARYLSTANMTVNPATTLEKMTNSQVNALQTMEGMLSATNSLGTHVPFTNFAINGSNKADPSSGSAYVGNLIVNTFGGKGNWNTSAAVGESAHFYMLNATSTNANAFGKVTTFGNEFGKATWTLANDGVLTYAAPVPEAETWAMFAAGLLAVGAVARRRRA